jgi:AdoMet-dependent rRNA methyltransferase SPB1
MGAILIQSKKKREDLIESGYNRWTSNDEGLPDWFMEEESKFCKKQLPVTKEMMEVYRAKLKEINARPIKKVAEAKARKKKRALKSMEKARKKAESITDADDISSQEKAQQIKQIYKKAIALGKKKKSAQVEYVVAKRGMGKRVRRPAGVKGRFKVVDPRMKKDNRAAKAAGKGKGRKGGAGRGKGRQQQRRKR